MKNDDSGWQSDITKNSWIKYDFKQYKILLKSYDIRSCYGPKSFKVEGSNDDSNWSLLDQKNSANDFAHGQNRRNHYDLSNNSNKYRYIRITQGDDGGWGDSSGTYHYFYIYNLYFYGCLYEIK